MRKACSCKELDRPLIETIVGMENKGEGEGCGDGCSSSLEWLTLDPKNIARVVPGRIMSVRFFPCSDSRMIVIGNKFGLVGFWNLDPKVEEEDGIYLYHPHLSLF